MSPNHTSTAWHAPWACFLLFFYFSSSFITSAPQKAAGRRLTVATSLWDLQSLCPGCRVYSHSCQSLGCHSHAPSHTCHLGSRSSPAYTQSLTKSSWLTHSAPASNPHHTEDPKSVQGIWRRDFILPSPAFSPLHLSPPTKCPHGFKTGTLTLRNGNKQPLAYKHMWGGEGGQCGWVGGKVLCRWGEGV